MIDEDNETSAENNSSVISQIAYNDSVLLFIGDSGVPALERAIIPFGVRNVKWLDMPHHGSKHNVNSGVLDRLMPDVAYFSARGTRKHPSVAVINSLKRRGCTCYSTHKSGSLVSPIGVGLRGGCLPSRCERRQPAPPSHAVFAWDTTGRADPTIEPPSSAGCPNYLGTMTDGLKGIPHVLPGNAQV